MAPASSGLAGLAGLGGVAPLRPPAPPSPPPAAASPPSRGERRDASALRPPKRCATGVALVAVEGLVAPQGDPLRGATVKAGVELPLPQLVLLEPGPAGPPSLPPE
jgi:hypothetical protein